MSEFRGNASEYSATGPTRDCTHLSSKPCFACGGKKIKEGTNEKCDSCNGVGRMTEHDYVNMGYSGAIEYWKCRYCGDKFYNDLHG